MDKKILKRIALEIHESLLDELDGVREGEKEDIAYSYFIRFVAIAFMQANGYIKERGLSLSLCRRLSELLPTVFEPLGERERSLFPKRFAESNPFSKISDDLWHNVEIVGWLYQFYFSKKHREVINTLHVRSYSKEQVPVATQLFTPEWVVKYILDNSLGRYWLERNPDSRLAELCEFYIPSDIHIKEALSPEELTFFDPCVGAGHFLSYAFDLLHAIYLEGGYSASEAARRIVKYNLFGVDIDKKASELASFTVIMKALSYDPDFLLHSFEPNVCEIIESEDFTAFRNAKEYGSLIKSDGEHDGAPDGISRVARILGGKYKIVATNPPYLNKYSPELKKFVSENYKDFSGDLFSVFMRRNLDFCVPDGYLGYMTPNVWLFIKAYEKLRLYFIKNTTITTLVQMAKGSFFSDATVDVTAFVVKNEKTNFKGWYIRLEDFKGDMALQEEMTRNAVKTPDCEYLFKISQDDFLMLPSAPIVYWLTSEMKRAFAFPETLGDKGIARNGMKTGDNKRFLRYWWEVDRGEINFTARSAKDARLSGARYFPYNKGGEYRKWYGNNYYVVNWQNGGEEIFAHAKADARHVQDYPDTLKFKPAVSWSLITSGRPSFRLKSCAISDIAGMCFYPDDDLPVYLAFCNSVVGELLLTSISPTINYQSGDVARLPVAPLLSQKRSTIEPLVNRAVELSREDWDSFELSWDFKRHPLIPENPNCSLSESFDSWKNLCRSRYNELTVIEEELDKIFINIYGFENILSPKVDSVSIATADVKRDVKSLISYAVGCMLGRYTLEGVLPSDSIPVKELSRRFYEFIEIAFGADTLDENISFVTSGLGRSVESYFKHSFLSDHFRTYRKHPVYTVEADSLIKISDGGENE